MWVWVFHTHDASPKRRFVLLEVRSINTWSHRIEERINEIKRNAGNYGFSKPQPGIFHCTHLPDLTAIVNGRDIYEARALWQPKALCLEGLYGCMKYLTFSWCQLFTDYSCATKEINLFSTYYLSNREIARFPSISYVVNSQSSSKWLYWISGLPLKISSYLSRAVFGSAACWKYLLPSALMAGSLHIRAIQANPSPLIPSSGSW